MRLKDIEVDEVSLVDKAANKRKFAFMKRDGTNDTVKEEVKEIENLVPPAANIDEPTPEELAEIATLTQEITELTALLTKKL